MLRAKLSCFLPSRPQNTVWWYKAEPKIGIWLPSSLSTTTLCSPVLPVPNLSLPTSVGHSNSKLELLLSVRLSPELQLIFNLYKSQLLNWELEVLGCDLYMIFSNVRTLQTLTRFTIKLKAFIPFHFKSVYFETGEKTTLRLTWKETLKVRILLIFL